MTTLEPVSVALKFGFLAVLYLFLLWVARSALKDLARRSTHGVGRNSGRCDRALFGVEHLQAPMSGTGSPGWWWSVRPGTTRG